MKITIVKQDHTGQEIWRYPGSLIHQKDDRIVIEAYFNRSDMEFHGMTLKIGDRFVETYFTRRWYNIYEIHDQADDALKGWYCNISYPARYQNGIVTYKDLALDLLVFPQGKQVVLDEDEFHSLRLSPVIRAKAKAALDELQAWFAGHESLLTTDLATV